MQNAELRTVIRTLPYSITQPGSYVVGASLTASLPRSNGITIAASDVTLDLGGFTLAGGGEGGGHGILVGGGLTNICVRNGAVSRWSGDGLQVTGNTDVTVEDFRAAACGGNGCVIEGGTLLRVTAEGNTGSGIVTGSRGGAGGGILLLTDCVFTGNGQDALTHKRPGKAKYKNIVLKKSGGNGMKVEAGKEGFAIDLDLDNVSSLENAGSGFRCAIESPGSSLRCRMDQCSFTGNGGDGLHLLQTGKSAMMNCTVSDCQFLHNKSRGALISSTGEGSRANARCLDSEFADNGGTGVTIDTRIRVGGPVTDCIAALERCVSAGNNGHGALIAHEAAHVVQQRCSGNAGHGLVIEDCDDANLAEVVALKNRGGGIRLHSQTSSCRNITASHNGGGGVDADCDGDGLMDLVVAQGNGRNGIRFRCGGKMTLSRCDGSTNQWPGISGDCDDTNADRCSASGNGGAGFDLSSSGTIRLSNSSASRNAGPGVRCICATGWTEKSFLTSNKGPGLEVVASDSATIASNVIAANEGDGVQYIGSYGDVSSNRCSSNKGNGISVDGEHNRIASNVVTNNDSSFALRSGVNPLYENTSGANKNPLYEEVANDHAPTAPASKATSPVSNIEAP